MHCRYDDHGNILFGREGGPCHQCGATDTVRSWEPSHVGGIGTVWVWECTFVDECASRRTVQMAEAGA